MSVASMAYKIPRICGDCRGTRQGNTDDAVQLTEYREAADGTILNQRTRTVCHDCENLAYLVAAEMNDITLRCDASPVLRTFTRQPM